jgi:hypothetical protein
MVSWSSPCKNILFTSNCLMHHFLVTTSDKMSLIVVGFTTGLNVSVLSSSSSCVYPSGNN